jgi:hypothetical protein
MKLSEAPAFIREHRTLGPAKPRAPLDTSSTRPPLGIGALSAAWSP